MRAFFCTTAVVVWLAAVPVSAWELAELGSSCQSILQQEESRGTEISPLSVGMAREVDSRQLIGWIFCDDQGQLVERAVGRGVPDEREAIELFYALRRSVAARYGEPTDDLLDREELVDQAEASDVPLLEKYFVRWEDGPLVREVFIMRETEDGPPHVWQRVRDRSRDQSASQKALPSPGPRLWTAGCVRLPAS